MASNVLNELQEIVECVLENFPVMEINKFMIVNKVWRDAGERVKRKRVKRLSWYTFDKAEVVGHQDFIKEMQCEPKLVLSFLTHLHNLTFKISKHNLCRKMTYKHYHTTNLPLQCIPVNIVTRAVTTYNGHAEEETNAGTCLYFPHLDDTTIQVIVHQNRFFHYYSCLHSLDPRDKEKVAYKSTRRSRKGLCCLARGGCGGDADVCGTKYGIISEGIQKESSAKLVLLFATNDFTLPQQLQQLRKTFKCPIAGSIAEKASIGKKNYDSVGIVVGGSEKVRVASVVVGKNCDVEQRLLSLRSAIRYQLEGGGSDKGGKDGSSSKGRSSSGGGGGNGVSSSGDGGNSGGSGKCGRDGSDSVGLKAGRGANAPLKDIVAWMFSCVGRGRCLYEELNVESSIFAKIFPGVPLFGTFDGGEIGQNSLKGGEVGGCHGDCEDFCGKSDDVGEAGDFSELRGRDDVHFYTTVFVIMAIKK